MPYWFMRETSRLSPAHPSSKLKSSALSHPPGKRFQWTSMLCPPVKKQAAVLRQQPVWMLMGYRLFISASAWARFRPSAASLYAARPSSTEMLPVTISATVLSRAICNSDWIRV